MYSREEKTNGKICELNTPLHYAVLLGMYFTHFKLYSTLFWYNDRYSTSLCTNKGILLYYDALVLNLCTNKDKVLYSDGLVLLLCTN